MYFARYLCFIGVGGGRQWAGYVDIHAAGLTLARVNRELPTLCWVQFSINSSYLRMNGRSWGCRDPRGLWEFVLMRNFALYKITFVKVLM